MEIFVGIRRCAGFVLFALVVGTLLLSCRSGGETSSATTPYPAVNSPLSADQLTIYQACSSDGDCMYVNNGCCDCANGGEDAAINKDKEDEFKARFDCEGIICTMMAPLKRCGCGTVSCEGGRCSYSKDSC